MGSHSSLGEVGRRSLRSLLHRYAHVFPAPGEPVTGRTTSIQHEILTSDTRPVRCGPHHLARREVRLSRVTAHGRLLWFGHEKGWIHAFLC